MKRVTIKQLQTKINAARKEITDRIAILSKDNVKDLPSAEVFRKHLQAILNQLDGVPAHAQE